MPSEHNEKGLEGGHPTSTPEPNRDQENTQGAPPEVENPPPKRGPSVSKHRAKTVVGTGPVKLSFVSLQIPRTSDQVRQQQLRAATGQAGRRSTGGELQVIVRGVANSKYDSEEELPEQRKNSVAAIKEVDEKKSGNPNEQKLGEALEQKLDTENTNTDTQAHPSAPPTPEETVEEPLQPQNKSGAKRDSTGWDDDLYGDMNFPDGSRFSASPGDEDGFELSEIKGPGVSVTPPTPKNSMAMNFAYEEMLGEDYSEGHGEVVEGDHDEIMLSEAETISSFQFNFRPSEVLRKSVDSQELAWKHGVHIAGHDSEEKEKEEPYKSEEELNEELKKQHERHTLLEQEGVVREVFTVWENISKYIIWKMVDGIAVRIPGLGTFTQAMLPNDLVRSRPETDKYMVRRLRKFPIFKMCPHVKEMCSLSEQNYSYQCNLPVLCMSTKAIALESKLSQGLVQGIITETLIAFQRGVCTNKDLEFPFPYIGKMYVKEGQIYMFFYKHFCEGLDFDFSQQTNMISSVILGSMTPLFYHRPAIEIKSVFHYDEMKPVEDKIRTNTQPYATGDLLRDDAEDRCKFIQKLFTHSNLPFDCSCCKKDKRQINSFGEDGEETDENTEGVTDFLCEFSKNYDRIERSCCTQPGRFSFQQPDGSTFTPEPLYRTAKTGNPVLDRLTDDRCLLHQALSCWIKRDFIQNLGPEEMRKHYDREYFRRADAKRKSFLEASKVSPEPDSTESEEMLVQEEVQRKSRESEFYKRLEACLIALEQADEQTETGDSSDRTMDTLGMTDDGELSDTSESRERRKSKRFNNFDVFGGLYYNLLDNDRAMKNESDFNLLSRTPSTVSPGGSPVLPSKTPSSGSSISTPSSPICWEQPLSSFMPSTHTNPGHETTDPSPNPS